jgi:hypothetical protein
MIQKAHVTFEDLILVTFAGARSSSGVEDHHELSKILWRFRRDVIAV